MPRSPTDLVSATSLVLLSPILAALDPAKTAVSKPVGSLPAPCIQLPALGTVLCATPINTLAIYRAEMISLAALRGVDVALVRHGNHPELIDDVTIDVVIARKRSLHLLWSMCAFRASDGGYWLVPPADGAGPSIQLDATGFSPMVEPPYRDMFERGDGVARAARETVLSLRRLRRPLRRHPVLRTRRCATARCDWSKATACRSPCWNGCSMSRPRRW